MGTHAALYGEYNLTKRSTGSRRLVVYSRLADADIDTTALQRYSALKSEHLERGTADELNDFRRRVSSVCLHRNNALSPDTIQFFEGFKPKVETSDQSDRLQQGIQ